MKSVKEENSGRCKRERERETKDGYFNHGTLDRLQKDKLECAFRAGIFLLKTNKNKTKLRGKFMT